MTVDTSGKKSFAVASVPVKYAPREPPRLLKAIASQPDQPPQPKGREAKPARSISQATTGESETSYQRYIISHADYMQVDSRATTTASTTPVTRGRGSEMKGQSLPSLQASSGASVSSKTRDSVQSSSSLSVVEGNGSGRFVSASSSQLQHSEDEWGGVRVGGSDGDSEVAALTSHPQSTALTLEIDMRFSSEPLDRSSSDRILADDSASCGQGKQSQLQSMSDLQSGSETSVDEHTDQESELQSPELHPTGLSDQESGLQSPELHPMDLSDQESGLQSPELHPMDLSDQESGLKSPELHPTDLSDQESGLQSPELHPPDLSDQESGLQSPELHPTDLSDQNQSGGGSTAVLEGEACPTSVTSVTSVTEGLPLQREGDTLASQAEVYAPLPTKPRESEAVISGVSLTATSMSQSTASELPFHSHSQELHSQELHSQEIHSLGPGSSSLVELATQRRPLSSNSESSSFDSSTLQADSCSERFSSPFSRSLSSFRMPSSLPSQAQSFSLLKSEEEGGSTFSSSQHDLDSSIPEPLPSLPPLQSASTLLASASVGSYTFASLPATIKMAASSIDEIIEGDNKMDERTQTGVSVSSLGFETRYDIQESGDLERGVEDTITSDGRLSPLLESSDNVGTQTETVTVPEVGVDSTDPAAMEDTELDVPFPGLLADDREGDTPTKDGRYGLDQQCV